jgi:hypothetical protein
MIYEGMNKNTLGVTAIESVVSGRYDNPTHVSWHRAWRTGKPDQLNKFNSENDAAYDEVLAEEKAKAKKQLDHKVK